MRYVDGVYKSGFATSPSAYKAAVIPLFDSLDRLEKILQGKDYLVGDRLTEADVRLFVTIVRHILMRPNAPLLTSCDRYALTQFMLDTSSATCAPFATGILQFTCGCASCIGIFPHSKIRVISIISRPITIGRIHRCVSLVCIALHITVNVIDTIFAIDQPTSHRTCGSGTTHSHSVNVQDASVV